MYSAFGFLSGATPAKDWTDRSDVMTVHNYTRSNPT